MGIATYLTLARQKGIPVEESSCRSRSTTRLIESPGMNIVASVAIIANGH